LSISGEDRSHIVNYAKSRAAIRSLDPELPGGTMFYLYMEYHPGAITGGGFRVNLHFNTPENCDEALAFGASADGKGGFFLFPPVSDVSRLAVFVFTHRDFAGCPHMSSGVGGRLGVGRTCRSTIPLTHGKKTPKGSE
jgi:hypothetical protein